MTKQAIIVVAIGEAYVKESERIRKTFPDTILVTDAHPLYVKTYTDPLVNGLWTKSNFAHYLPKDLTGPVFLMDADLYTNEDEPLANFVSSADVSAARYPGTWNYPTEERQAIYEALGGNINSGLVYFRNSEIAREVSKTWSETYAQRIAKYGTSRELSYEEYDEPALLETLASGRWAFEFLDPKWHTWDGPTGPGIFHQHHTVVGYPYTDLPFG